ncbi:phage tail tube assembly chaperone [Pediococcus acidilactici]|uniref:phage tail tube assembly chaperone n=1 Tax=Pediococcus acidilactici TaxID=1254 RepID=UPI00232E82BC|nr:phage tail tube assembly chaperone [Pediococcus acidilactici]MDB8867682.1 phage tail tube assembly chaperone [Pediococcus acidilactici]
MTIKINTKVIGIKGPIEIKPTVGLTEEATNVMIEMLESEVQSDNHSNVVDEGNLSDEEKQKIEQENLKNMLKEAKDKQAITNHMLDFIKNTLKLTETQIKKVKYTINDNELGQFIAYLVQRIQGFSEEQIKLNQEIEVKKRKEQDPKK